jgi:hypothetical protein
MSSTSRTSSEARNQKSRTVKIEDQELSKSKGSNTDLNYTDFNDTDSFLFPSVRENQSRETNRSEARREYREFICENIDYEILCGEYPYEKDMLEEILELMVDTVCTTKETVRFVMDALQENTTKVRNIRQYLLATLYNAPMTISNHFRSLVNHDMANGLI